MANYGHDTDPKPESIALTLNMNSNPIRMVHVGDLSCGGP